MVSLRILVAGIFLIKFLDGVNINLIESSVSKLVNQVKVTILNHHSFKDANKTDFFKYFSPTISIIQDWAASYPSYNVA